MPDMIKLGAHSPDEEAERLNAVCGVYAGKSETPICDANECEIIPSLDPNYDGPHLWVEKHIAQALEKETVRLREALQYLYDDCVDYLTINKFGGIDNWPMKRARDALSPAPTERADK